MSQTKDTSENFTQAHESSSHKLLAVGSGLLSLVFIILLVLNVDNGMGRFMWLAFSIASAAATGVFLLMLKVDQEKAARAH